MGLVDDTSMDQVLLFPHLGLGDALICNAIVRHLAAKHALVVVLCKPHNRDTEDFMWRDVINLDLCTVRDDDQAKEAAALARQHGYGVVGLGFWGEQPFDRQQWDREFYRQARVDFQQRWSGFVVSRQPSREHPIPAGDYCLIHEDKERGYLIDRSRLPKMPIVEITPKSGNLFDFWGLTENATELHFMESSPAILADSLPLLKAKRKAIHCYCRESVPPKYQADWEMLR